MFEELASKLKIDDQDSEQSSSQTHHPHYLHLSEGSSESGSNRFRSFAPERNGGNEAKWYVDGCGYMWAVSIAIEEARESIWILDWWLSPELYLRRPPSKNEAYRIDRMLLAAAERGVKVNIIIYKEVAAVLTRESKDPLSPTCFGNWLMGHDSVFGAYEESFGITS